MELTGERTIALNREQVWSALNDPGILKRCLPGCELFEREAENRFKVGMTAAVGPVKARFNGRLTLSDLQPPSSYALAFEGSGGAAGFGKGQARVSLAEEGPQMTRLAYAVKAQVGGRLAQVGARLVDGVARKMSDEFFTRFAREVVPAGAAATTQMQPPADPAVRLAGSEPASAASGTPGAAPTQDWTPAPRRGETEAQADLTRATGLAVLSAAVAAVAAAVAVLAASIALYAVR